MPRQCQRWGCGKGTKGKNQFCSKACRREVTQEERQLDRAKILKGKKRCPYCGILNRPTKELTHGTDGNQGTDRKGPDGVLADGAA